MTTDRQKVCKCGADVAEFLSDIRILENHVKTTKMENSAIFIPAFKSYVNSIYSNIGKIEDDCSIDADKIRWSHSDIFNKIEKIGEIRDPKQFDEKREDIIRDLNSISYDVVRKVTECSK